MRGAYLAMAGCAFLLACSAPEDSNPAVRCGADDSCPDALECYRGFCVEDGDDPELPISFADAGAVADASAATPSVVATDAAVVSATKSDAAEVLIQDAPGTLNTTPTTTETSTPVVSTPVVTTPVVTTPVVSAPVPVMPAPAAPPCQAECANALVNDKPCKNCFKTSFGDDPDKLCGTTVAAFNPLLQTVCAAICATGKAKGPSGCRGN